MSPHPTLALCAATCLGFASQVSWAVEGGVPGYLLSQRDSLAGIAPPAGTYIGLDLVTFSGDITGLSIAGLPIRAMTDIEVDLLKLSITQTFGKSLWGGTPGINVNIPYLVDATLSFTEQEKWFRSPQLSLTSPYITNLKLDPFERFHEARGYDEWAENRSWIFGPAGAQIARFVASFKEFPPSQESMSLQVDDVSNYINSQSGAR